MNATIGPSAMSSAAANSGNSNSAFVYLLLHFFHSWRKNCALLNEFNDHGARRSEREHVVLSSTLLKLGHRLQNIDSNESCTGAIKVIFTTIIIIKVIFFLLVAYDALSSCLNPNILDIKVTYTKKAKTWWRITYKFASLARTE